jgi:hypothetical protein
MMIDWTISVGNMLQLVALLGAAISMYFGLSYRLKGVETAQVLSAKEMEKLSGVVVTLAVQTTEIAHLRKRIDDLSEGKGFNLDHYPQMLKRHQI